MEIYLSPFLFKPSEDGSTLMSYIKLSNGNSQIVCASPGEGREVRRLDDGVKRESRLDTTTYLLIYEF